MHFQINKLQWNAIEINKHKTKIKHTAKQFREMFTFHFISRCLVIDIFSPKESKIDVTS